MKSALTQKLGLLVFALLFASPAFASKMATCKVKTNDIGTITGVGETQSDAFTDAALQCYDRRELLFKTVKGKNQVDTDSGLVMIDECANIKCGGKG